MSELEIFAAASQMTDASQRSAYLDRICGSDAALRQRLEVLLRNHAGAGSFLESPAAAFLAGEVSTQTLEQLPSGEQVARQRGSGAATQSEPGVGEDDKGEDIFGFLQPSATPGALGRLGHYEVLEVLGQGGFGTVVRAFDEKLHRMVAIKVMSPQLAATSPARKRFIREARSSAAIRHVNVVDIHAIEEQPIPFLVMEYIAGETLQERLDRTGPLDTADILRIGVQIAQGLAAAHAMGKIHRDIKPANILLENGVDHVKITDFGLARAADDASLTQSGVIAGTPLYMAPEQAQSLALDHRADLFSLGSVLYVMCSGRPPFRAASTLAVLKRVAEDTPRPIREIIPEVPQRLVDVISKLHSKMPEDRYQTATEVAAVLGKILAEPLPNDTVRIEIPPGSTNKPNPAAVPRRGRRLAVAGVALVTLLFVALIFTEATGVSTLNRRVRSLFSSEAASTDRQTAPSGHVIGPPLNGTPTGRVIDPPAEGKPDRRAADWVLSIGGTVRVNDMDRDIVDLPKEPFRLTYVNLANNKKVNEEGLAHFQGCKNLTFLELDFTNVNDAGLAYFKDCQNLTSLNLGGTRVSDVGLAYFKDCMDLQHLDVSNSLVSDKGLAQMTGCRKLLIANAKNTKVAQAGVTKLFGAVPTSKVIWDGGVVELTGGAAPDRRAAEYVLAIGGYVYIRNSVVKNLPISAVAGLPQGAFELTHVFLQRNQNVSDASLALLKDCQHLMHLDLRDTMMNDAGMAYFRDHKSLQFLFLSRTNVTDAGLAYFKDCTRLAQLALGGDQVSDAGLANFAGCKNLVTLELSGAKISNAGLASFKGCGSLLSLWLGGAQLDDTGLVHFRECKNLEILKLSGVAVGDEGLVHFKDCKNLIHVDLSGTKVHDAGLVHFKDCKNLAALELTQTQAGNAGLAHFKDCKNLIQLELANSQVTDEGLALLAAYPKLLSVNVKNTQVTEAGVKAFAAALPTCWIKWQGAIIEPTVNTNPDRRAAEWLLATPGYAQLRLFAGDTVKYRLSHLPKTPFQLVDLYINAHPKVSDETLSMLKGLRHLTHLRISHCKVTDAALGCFKDCARLQELQLDGAAVTDVGLAQLAIFTNLRYLNVKETGVTEAGVKQLAAALPKCRIEWDGGVVGPK